MNVDIPRGFEVLGLSKVESGEFDLPPQRYYIIHTISLSEKNINKLNKKIEEIKEEHGCQIIIDNFSTCLLSYLRLIDNIEDFINLLSKNITKDKELKLIHKKKWKQLIEKKYGK